MDENLKYVKPFLKFMMKEKEPLLFVANAVIWVVDAFLFIENPKLLAAPTFVIVLCGVIGWVIQYSLLYATYSLEIEDKEEAAKSAATFSFLLLLLFSFISFISKDNFFGLLTYSCGGSVVYFLINYFKKAKA